MRMVEAAPKHRHPSLSAEVQECSPLDADALGSALYGLGSRRALALIVTF